MDEFKCNICGQTYDEDAIHFHAIDQESFDKLTSRLKEVDAENAERRDELSKAIQLLRESKAVFEDFLAKYSK